MWDPVHQPGIEPVPLYWKRGVLTTGPLGKSQICAFLRKKLISFYDSDGKESAFSVGDPGSRRTLEEGMATHFSILTWRIPWTEECGGL